MYLLNKIIELIILRYNRIMCYEWTQETTWRVVSISTKYLKKKKEKKKKEKNAKLLHLKIKKEVKRENSLYSSKSQHPISTFDRLLPWMVQTTIMIKKSPAIGNDDAPVKISTLKKKKKKKKRSAETTRREGEVDKEARFFEKKRTNGSGRSVLLFQDFPGAVNFSSTPTGSIFARKYRQSLLFLFLFVPSKGRYTDETSPLFISIYGEK